VNHNILEASCASETLCFIEEFDNEQSLEKEDYGSGHYECFFLIHSSNPSVYELNSVLQNCL
jgi:hypothetical protein